MNKCYRLLNMTIILTMLMGVVVIPVAAVEPGPGDIVMVRTDSGDVGQFANYSRTRGALKSADDWAVTEETEYELVQGDKVTGVYIVYLVDAPLALYTGGLPGLAATNPTAAGVRKLDVNAPPSLAYRSYLTGKRDSAIQLASKALGRELNIKFEYEAVANGFAAEMSAQEAAQLEKLPEVWRVEPERMEYILTDAGPWWIGADGIWDGSGTGMDGTKGEGIIVGIIDTGIDPWNPSFADIGGDSYDHTNPRGSGNYVGVCDPTNTSPPAGVVAYDPTFPCNDKLIGVWGYTDADVNPRDRQGHGSHVSSTAAGNVTYNTTITLANGLPFSMDISGVAPHANLIVYDGCTDAYPGGCPSSATTKAKDQVILDGVDVLNYSIGGLYAPNPWTYSDALLWLAIREAGIHAVIAAGNSGPEPGTVEFPGVVPWATTVGNLTHNRAFINTLVLTNTNPLSDSIEIVGLGLTSGMTQTANIVYSIDYANPPTITVEDARLCGKGDPDFPDNPFPPGTFNGEIVVCERGSYPRVDKSRFVADAGAGGFVLAQPDAASGGPGSRVADPHVIPGLHIDYDTYQVLKTALASGYDMGIILGSERDLNDNYADIMATSSSRGPNASVPDLIVPSVAAPGSSIWAAHRMGAMDGVYTYNMIGGTSMASPHVAGTYALLASLHPDWTPAEAQSAVMLTSDTTVILDDATTQATPFDMGSGRVQASMAAKAGFVLDITVAEYEAANPSLGGDPKALNTASMADSQCVGVCSWVRTLRSVVPFTVTWTASADPPAGTSVSVTPANFVLGPGETQVVEVEFDVTALNTSGWVFGMVNFTPNTTETVPAHIPLAVVPGQFRIPVDQKVKSQRDAGGKMLTDLQSKLPILNFTGMLYGLQLPDEHTLSLHKHALPTTEFPDVFFTDMGNIGIVTLTVPADTPRIVATILDTTSPDLDMLLLYDEDGDGMPEYSDTAKENYCESAVEGSYEVCSVMQPPSGTWWVMILNYKASVAGQSDDIILGTTILTSDAGNLMLDGPSSVAQGTPYSITVMFDEMMMPGETWYGAVGLATDISEDPFGMFAFDVKRLSDDVTKEGPMGALVGETVMYTITVDTNILYDVPLNYMITDTLPSGMTLVPGSAGANIGTVMEDGNRVLWEGTMGVPTAEYQVTDSHVDPTCDTVFGGYFDLYAQYGFETLAGLAGNSINWSFTSLGLNTEFYGDVTEKPFFTDDGFTMFADDNVGTEPWINQDIPDPDAPNGIVAQYWRNMEISYSPVPTNAGVTGVSWLDGALWLVEFDNVNVVGDPAENLDYEIMMWRKADPSPGTSDIMIAFDNVNISDSIGTVGIEDSTGSIAAQYAYDDFIPTDGLVVCLDWVYIGDPAVITYEAMIDKDVTEDSLTNTVVHDTDMMWHEPEMTSYTTWIYSAKADWTKKVKVGGMTYDYTDSPIVVYEGQWPRIVDTVSVTSTETVSFTLTSMASGALELRKLEVNDGTVARIGDDLVWEIPGSTGMVDNTYILTSTYQVDESTDLTAMVVESLDLQKGVPEDDRKVEFEIPFRLDKLAPSLASTGSQIGYQLAVSRLSLLTTFKVTDPIPAGVSFAGNLESTGGLAVYDAIGDVVVWTSPGNVVVDPSFETGSPNTAWTEGGDIASPICSLWCGVNAAITGEYYLWFGGWGTTNMAYVAQTVTIPVADEAVLSFWMAIGADPVTDEIMMEFEVDGELVAVYTQEDALVYGDYTLVSVDITKYADGGDHLLMLTGTEIGDTLANVFIDDVSIIAGSKNLTALFDVMVESPLGTSVTNTAEFDFGTIKFSVDAVTDIRTMLYMPWVMRIH